MAQRPILPSDITAICEVLRPQYEWIADRIEWRINERDCAELLQRGKLLLPGGSEPLDVGVIELFRQSEWCLRQWKLHPSEHEFTIDIQRKQFLDPMPCKCFHATPAENETGIRSNGILIGRDVGKQNSPRYADSIHFVHASLTLADAAAWAQQIFPDKVPVYFPVDLVRSGYRLFTDTAAGDSTAFVFDVTVIDRRHLGEVIRYPITNR